MMTKDASRFIGDQRELSLREAGVEIRRLLGNSTSFSRPTCRNRLILPLLDASSDGAATQSGGHLTRLQSRLAATSGEF
jgi:hypothetical protein